jgi:hypothetical protein
VLWRLESERSRRTSGNSTIVVPEHSAEALSAFDLAVGHTNMVVGVNDAIVQPLVVSLCVEVGEVFTKSASQRVLSEQDHPVEALLLD